MKGARLAVFGLARSGISVAKAALDLGAVVTVVDEKSSDDVKKRSLAEELQGLGASVCLGWDGSFSSHDFDFVVTSPGVPMRHPKLQEANRSGMPVHSEVEFAYRISSAPILAITGTNGKSTSTAMTFECLKAVGFDVVLCGNIYGSGYQEVPLTEAAHRSSASQVLVAEVSSFQLEWVSSFKPVAAAVTNIRPDHLDRYEGFAEYAKTKRQIFASQGSNDFAVVGEEEAELGYPTRLVFGSRGEAVLNPSSMTVLGRTLDYDDLAVLGDHNYQNAALALLMTAAAETRIRGGSLRVSDQAATAVAHFKGIAHRMEALGERGGIRVINNSMCTNPAAVIASSQSIHAHQHLLLGGTNKRLDFAPLHDYLERSGHRAYLFGRDAHSLKEQLGTEGGVFETLADAFADAIRNANPGDVVMLAPGCASMDQFEDFRDRGNVFRAMAKEWLES